MLDFYKDLLVISEASESKRLLRCAIDTKHIIQRARRPSGEKRALLRWHTSGLRFRLYPGQKETCPAAYDDGRRFGLIVNHAQEFSALKENVAASRFSTAVLAFFMNFHYQFPARQ